MKIAVTLVLYALAFMWGCTRLTGKGAKLQRLWLGGILVWCLYVNICGIAGKSHISLASPYTAIFQPAGKFIIEWLGG